MIRRYIALLLSLLSLSPLIAQSDLWQSHIAVGRISQVQDLPDHLLLVTEGAIAVANKSNPSDLYLLDGSTPISELNPSMMLYDPTHKVTTVYYPSGGIDLIYPDNIYNLSGLKDNIVVNDKRARRIFYMGDYAFIAGHFGLLQIDLAGRQILATAFLGHQVSDAFTIGKELYALTEEGLQMSTLDKNIQDPAQWSKIDNTSTSMRRAVVASDGAVWYIDDGQRLYRQERLSGTHTPQDMLGKSWATELSRSAAGVVAIGPEAIIVWRPNGERKEYKISGQISSVAAQSSSEVLWVVAGEQLLKINLDTDAIDHISIQTDTPRDNLYFYMTHQHGRLYTLSGGRTYQPLWISGAIKIYQPPHWHNITDRELWQWDNFYFHDAVSIAVDPKDADHYFVGSWGAGLYEFNDGTLRTRYTDRNAPLTKAWIGEGDEHALNVGSLCYDTRGTLWMAQGTVDAPIIARTPDGQMTAHSYDGISKVNSFGKMIAMPNGVKWLLINHRGESGTKGVFIFNDSGTPHDPADDQSLLISQFSDRSGKSIDAKDYNDMVVDRLGNLWIATNKGPIYVNNPAGIFSLKQQPTATRPVGGKEPNLYYTLDNIPLTAIAVDALNNKWVGTAGDGLYQLSADGSELLNHYTKDNSPLLTEAITSLCFDETSGQLYIGTSSGLLSYYIGTTEHFREQSRQAYIYPNPLRPDDPDLLTLSGLAAGSTVRVLDAAGNLLYQGTALTGELTFAPKLPSGDRYPSGIYQVLLTDTEGKQGYTLSFAVIN